MHLWFALTLGISVSPVLDALVSTVLFSKKLFARFYFPVCEMSNIFRLFWWVSISSSPFWMTKRLGGKWGEEGMIFIPMTCFEWIGRLGQSCSSLCPWRYDVLQWTGDMCIRRSTKASRVCLYGHTPSILQPTCSFKNGPSRFMVVQSF